MWELDCEESWVLKNWCFWTVVLEKTLESSLDCKESQPVHPKGDLSWIFIGRTDTEAKTNTSATWCEERTHLKRPWCWERLKAEGEGDDRGWDGWMASLTQWTWVWVSSGSWWWTGRPGVLQSMGSQRVRHAWAIELNWTVWYSTCRWLCNVGAYITTTVCVCVCSAVSDWNFPGEVATSSSKESSQPGIKPVPLAFPSMSGGFFTISNHQGSPQLQCVHLPKELWI